ncbi:HMG (high mobility group) box domain-containing protein [Rhizoctonia solani AG-1 IA]|uniref:HMG (High mobility group) box domain-containing protein n=1 Tax=Thanatephorus cucumeris (strain AG1-IA) TaxID=983506 RepID=L8WPS2_THACA|nr:HMG (high mobility group) box domain-containing protein [Rhizoctonia solani AG-1 IA]
MADHPGLSAKDGQLVDKLAEVSANMRQAATLADSFAHSIAQLFPGTVSKRGRVPKEGKRVKDPNAPKRPATSYIMFQNDIRDELRRKHPGLPYKGKLIHVLQWTATEPDTELLGKVSEAWAALGEDQKKAYQNVADTNMAKYNRAVIDYKGSLNGHAAATPGSAAPTPEGDEEEEDEEEEEEEEEENPPAKKSKPTATAPARAVESEEDSDAASSVSEESDDTPVAPPPPPVKATKPPSSVKDKKKSKK